MQALGVQATPSNIAWMQQWAASEGAPGNTPGYWNPFNIKDSSGNIAYFGNPSAGLAATLQYMEGNGNFGSLGTYGQEVAAFLNGQPNNLPSSFAYWSGHSGNPSLLSTSYQQLVNSHPSGTVLPGTTPSALSIIGVGPGLLGAAAANAIKPIIPTPIAGFMQQLEAGVVSGALLLGAVILVAIGGLWIVLSDKNTQNIIAASTKGVETAALA